jgi:hypothetical protein
MPCGTTPHRFNDRMNQASTDLPRHLGILLERLQHPTDYETAFHYFLEEFGGDHEFIALGEPERPPFLVKILDTIAGRMLSATVTLDNLCLSDVPGHGFHHGSARVDDRSVIVFYFDAANLGLLVMIPGVRGAAEFARFQLPVDPSRN